eukprot:6092607-Pleurochrysis_carterae.AAC.1
MLVPPMKAFVQPARSRCPTKISTTTAVATVLDLFTSLPFAHAKRERSIIVTHHADSDASCITGIP